jgi:hypothetical protein
MSKESVRSFDSVLADEVQALRTRREQVNGLFGTRDDSTMGRVPYTGPPPPNARELRPFGVCFSGGGIRSATFNLGVIQGLCRRGLLPYIDYLSTVSGGGYIGSWLHGVILRKHGGNPVTAQEELVHSKRNTAKPGDARDDPVTFLRKYSNYLAPKLGLFSGDTWTIVGVWLRNMSLNLLILLPFLAGLILLARRLGMLQIRYGNTESALWWCWLGALVFVVLVMDVRLSIIVYRQFPDSFLNRAFSGLLQKLKADRDGTRLNAASESAAATAQPIGERHLDRHPNRWSWAAIVMTLLAASVLGAAPGVGSNDFRTIFLIISPLFFLHQFLGGFPTCFLKRHATIQNPWRGGALIVLLFFIPVICAAITARGLVFVRSCLQSTTTADGWLAGGWLPFTIGPALVILVWMAGISLQIGLMGVDYPDTAREWLTQFGAQLAIAMSLWTGFLVLSYFGPLLVFWLAVVKGPLLYTAVSGWVASGIAAFFSGTSAKTKGNTANEASRGSPSLEKLATVVPPIFSVLTLLLVSFGAHLAVRYMVFGTAPLPPAGADWRQWFSDWYWPTLSPMVQIEHPGGVPWLQNSPAYATLLLGLAGVLTGILLSLRFNINEFSMHHFYKNRLVRCYLGAGNAQKRHPDRLTGFDSRDDFQISSLKATAHEPYNGPYPIVNCALNLNTGSELATAERKATSFVFTPNVCGFEPKLSAVDEVCIDQRLSADGYRDTEQFMMPNGPDLGTAMAISGAAANPNAGFHTSTPMAFLLTVFDVRFGWWVGNPRREKQSRHPGPRVALRSLLAELFAQTDSRSFYVNLSDGGHFENLGLYELVRRRCRYIIAGDAEEDPNYSFEALGSAIRKCRADFGIEIDIDIDSLRPAEGKKVSAGHCVVGTIHYREPERGEATRMCEEAEPADPSDMQGWLVYFKASMTGDEPEDVQQYRVNHPKFPHEPTSNQFFTESQFESYRRLGEHAVASAFDRVKKLRAATAEGRLLELFQDLYRKWHPAGNEEKPNNFTERYNGLMKRLAEDPDLEFIGWQFFPDRAAKARKAFRLPLHLNGEGDGHRKAFYYCLDAIQLMEDVYFTLELFDKANRYSPGYAGWMSTFHIWAHSPEVRQTWAVAKSGYNKLFQEFFATL